MPRTPSKPPTLIDVAEHAGVSVPTASRVLNGGVRGRNSGSADVRKRVEAAARALGYSVSAAAQTTKGGRARTVAVVVSDMDDYGAATIISGVMHAAEERGLSVAVRATGDDATGELELFDQLRGERHRAVLVATSRTTDDVREQALGDRLRLLEEQGTRVVLIGDSQLPFPSVTTDNRRAASRLAVGLATNGARRFAIAAGPEDEITSLERASGFREGLAQAGIDTDGEPVLVHQPFTRDGGYAAAVQLEPVLDEVDVVAAMSDAMAVGIIARLRERGIDVPGQIEVSGFDHVALLGDVLPEFSTVEVPLKEFGRSGLELALRPRERGRNPSMSLESRPIVRGRSLS